MGSETDKAFATDLLHTLNGMMNAGEAHLVAIMPAAFLEVHLASIIESKMPGINSALRAKLFEGEGALSTLSAKIDIAQALGAIELSLARRIILVARIRNRFAHRIKIRDFDNPEVADLVDKLASHGSPGPKIVTEEGLKPLLKDNREGLFMREAMAVCFLIAKKIAGDEKLTVTDETIPKGVPGIKHTISF